MFKKLLIATTLSSAFLLTGCDGEPPEPKVQTECKFNNAGLIECKIVVTWQKSMGNFDSMQQLAYEDVAIDFTNSQRQLLDQPFGYNMNDGVVTLKNNGSVVAVKASAYSKQGQKVVAQNSQDISSWMGGYNGQADEIVLEIVNLTFETQTGPNSITAEVTHNGGVLAGSTTGQYKSETDSIGNH